MTGGDVGVSVSGRSPCARRRLRYRQGLIALLAAAAGARAFCLDSGLWFDEVVTLVEYVRRPWLEIAGSFTTLNNHILYSLLARACVTVLGEAAWTLRLPAVVFGLASLAALFSLGAGIVGRRQALAATALLAFSYHHVWFSQNARGYTGLLLWTLLATALFLRGARTGARTTWIAYALVFGGATYTHLTGAFVFVGHGLVYVTLAARRRWGGAAGGGRIASRYPGLLGVGPVVGFAGGAALAALLYAPLVPQVLSTIGQQAGPQSVNVKVAEWRSPLWFAMETVRNLHLGPAATLGVVAAAVLGFLGVADLWRRRRLFLVLALVPVPVIAGSVLALSFHMWPRYYFVECGFAALIMVRGACRAAGLLVGPFRLGRRVVRPVGSAIVFSLVAVSASSVPRNYRTAKQDYEGAYAFVESSRAPGDAVFTAGLASFVFSRYVGADWAVVTTPEPLREARTGAGSTWFVYSFPKHLGTAFPALSDEVRDRFDVVRSFPATVGDGEIYVCRARPE